jgi:hypothetical protein
MLLLVACGSRTGLFTDDTPAALPPDDGGGGVADGSAGRDSSKLDSGPEPDALPPIDARPPVDANKTDCPDADATLIYVITTAYELFSFLPTDGSFKKIGNIACPAPNGTTPFSMAVDRKGVAYIVFNDGHLYRVSTATAACIGTSFAVGQGNFVTFGMGYATIGGGPAEELFIAGDGNDNGPVTNEDGLGRIDTKSFLLSKIGDFIPHIDRAELTGTGTGQLYGFYSKANAPGSFIGEIDKTTAHVVAETHLTSVEQNGGWAFAFWGGDFYTFTEQPPQGSLRSVVTRYRPADGSVQEVASLPTLVVGAGVSTCAPEQ